jgi:hypothetical protein
VGAILRAVYERQLDGDVSTVEEAIALAQQVVKERHARAEP